MLKIRKEYLDIRAEWEKTRKMFGLSARDGRILGKLKKMRLKNGL